MPAIVVAEFGELPLGGSPGEVAVGLGEAEFGQPVLAGRRGESLGQKQHVGVGVLDLTDQPRPEVGRLGVRVVDPKELDAVVNPVPDHAQHLVVKTGGIVVEVDRIDVLVLLRRILRVGDGAVRQFGEPLPVLAGPRMIRRALQRQVQGHLHAQIACRGDEFVEVVDRAQIRMNSVVAALVAADRPWRPHVCREPRWGSCCGPCGVPCRSGGSAAGTRRRTPSRRCAEAAAAAVAKVPCTGLPSASQPPVERGNISYHEPKRASGRSTQTPNCSPRVTSSRNGKLRQEFLDFGSQRQRGAGHRVPGGPQRCGGRQQRIAPLARHPRRGTLEQRGADQQVVGQFLLTLAGVQLGDQPCRQVWIGSPHPSTRKVHSPTRSGVN